MILALVALILAVVSGGVVLGVGLPQNEVGLARIALGTQALLAAGASVYLALYVAGEDDYRANGTTRWEAYDAKGLTLTAVALGLAVAVLAVALAAWPRRRFFPALGLAGIVAAVLIFLAFVANTLN